MRTVSVKPLIMKKSSTFAGPQIKVLCLMYLGYAVSMILKSSIIAVSPALVADPVVAMSKTQFGEILASGSFGGIIGKVIFGLSADRFGGKLNFLVSLLMLSLGIIFFGLSYNYIAFMTIFFCLAMSKAGGWPSLAKLINNWYRLFQYGRAWGVISTASRSGTIIATLGLGFLLQYLSWQQVLFVAGLIGVSMVCVWFFVVKEVPAEAPSPVKEKEPVSDQHKGHHLYNKTLRFALFDFLKSKRVWLIFLAMMGLTIMVDFLNFVPMFIKETLNISSADAVMTASAFPIGSFIAVLVGGYIFDKLSTQAMTKVVGVFLAIAVLCLLIIFKLSYFELSLSKNILVVYICLFTFGFSVAPAYYLPMSLFSIRYGGPFSGILISILDLGGYFATAVFGLVAGRVADLPMGWSKLLILLMIMGIITLFLTVWFLHNEVKTDNT